jgi:hypothetical protein
MVELTNFTIMHAIVVRLELYLIFKSSIYYRMSLQSFIAKAKELNVGWGPRVELGWVLA